MKESISLNSFFYWKRIRDERQRGFFCECSFVFVNHHRHEKIYLFIFFLPSL